MPFRDSGWRPDLGESYKGHDVYDHNVAPYQFHEEDEDGEAEEISFDWDEIDPIVEPNDE